jgi:PhnB protein
MVVLEVSDPPHARATPGAIYVYVPDVNSAYEIALRHGAESVASPVDKPYQERSGGVKDGLGTIWWISTFRG